MWPMSVAGVSLAEAVTLASMSRPACHAQIHALVDLLVSREMILQLDSINPLVGDHGEGVSDLVVGAVLPNAVARADVGRGSG